MTKITYQTPFQVTLPLEDWLHVRIGLAAGAANTAEDARYRDMARAMWLKITELTDPHLREAADNLNTRLDATPEPTCVGCDRIEAECRCDYFDSERK